MATDHDYNPFQSPAAILQPAPGMASRIIPFQSGHPRATAAIVLLAITALLCILGAIASVVEFDSLEGRPDGSFMVTGTGAAIADVADSVSNLILIVWAATVIAFCMWTHRAHRNLSALGAGRLRFTPGWAVGWFFVPLANLVMPYFVSAEIWRESDPAQKHLDGYAGKNTSPLVAGWWLAYVSYMVVPTLVGIGFAVQIGLSVANRPGNPQDLVMEAITHWLPSLLLLGLGAQLLGLLASVLAIAYVYRTDANQQAKHALFHGDGYFA